MPWKKLFYQYNKIGSSRHWKKSNQWHFRNEIDLPSLKWKCPADVLVVAPAQVELASVCYSPAVVHRPEGKRVKPIRISPFYRVLKRAEKPELKIICKGETYFLP